MSCTSRLCAFHGIPEVLFVHSIIISLIGIAQSHEMPLKREESNLARSQRQKGNCASSPLSQMARERKSVNNNQALEGCTKHISYRVCTSFRNSLEMHFAVIRNVYKPKPFIANILIFHTLKILNFFIFVIKFHGLSFDFICN